MIPKRCLRIIYNDKKSSFAELLIKESSVSINTLIHKRNIGKLATEMFKFSKGLSPPLMDNIFKLTTENPYTLRQVSELLGQLLRLYNKELKVYHI